MKKLFAILALLPIAQCVLGQAITINATDIPVPVAPFVKWDFTAIAAAPNPAATVGGYWDYSPHFDFTVTDTFFAETDTFFTSAGTDVYKKSSKSFNSFFGYDIRKEINFSSGAITENGMSIPYQGFDISFSTGTSGDSLIIPAQKLILPSGGVGVMSFPLSFMSFGHSSVRAETNFDLTVAAYSLNHTPAKHVFYKERNDSVIGWGKMRVYTLAGTSMLYDVLMRRTDEKNMDSFYLAGMPAPTPMLSSFNIVQNQLTDSNFRIELYRKGSFCPILTYDYGADYTYTNPIARYSDSAVITANASAGNISQPGFTTVLYPNPCNGRELNLMILGNIQLKNYTIIDVTGRIVATGKTEFNGDIMRLNIKLTTGNYLLTAGNAEEAVLVREPFVVSE